MHPGLQRAWLQTGGLPVLPIHGLMRAAFDQVDRVEYLGAGCAKLFDAKGVQVGILQFQAALQDHVDKAALDLLAAAAAGDEPERQPDREAGDTVIRKLDMTDPVDRETARLASLGNGAIMDQDLTDPPPIDLPDYVPDHADDDDGMIGGSPWGCAAALFVGAMMLAAVVALLWRLTHA